jgi:hypothetical protein
MFPERVPVPYEWLLHRAIPPAPELLLRGWAVYNRLLAFVETVERMTPLPAFSSRIFASGIARPRGSRIVRR